MASAVVPSRAKAAGRPAGSTPSGDEPDSPTYIRMTLVVDALHGSALSPAPIKYFFRWMRADKQAKVSAARVVSPSGEHGVQMVIYAQVRRPSREIVHVEGTDPLNTTLVLVSIDPSANNVQTVISTCPFDMGDYLASLVDSGSLNMGASLQFSSDVTAAVTIMMKCLGENHLKRYAPEPRRLGMRATTPHAADADEAVAALEIERLRRQVPEEPKSPVLPNPSLELSDSQDNLGSSEMSTPNATGTPLMPVTATVPASFDELTPTAPTDLTSLQNRIRELEIENASVKRDRHDAERKVAAHVAHAQKIKETYTQLAMWYNNLRHEHIELQNKVPKTGHESEAPPRVNSNASSSTYEADLKKIDEERESNQVEANSEKSQEDEALSRNSQLLESKARSLAELREQWDAAQEALSRKDREAEERAEALRETQKKLEFLETQLIEKDAIVNEKESALSEANKRLQDMETSHSRALADAELVSNQRNEENLLSEISELRRKHTSELEEAVEDAKKSVELTLKQKLELAKAEKDEELAQLRTNITEEIESRHAEELSRLRLEHENSIEAERNSLQRLIEQSESKARGLREAADGSTGRLNDLQNQLDDLKKEYKNRVKEMNAEAESREASVQQQLAALVKENEAVSQQLEIERNDSAKLANEISVKEIERGETLSILQSECSQLREHVAALEKERDELRESSQQIDAVVNSDINHEEEIAELNGQLADLKSSLRVEIEKRKEMTGILEKSDREHDELRDMVTRLRSERDKAIGDIKHVQDELAQAKRGPLLRNQGSKEISKEVSKESVEALVEARDRAFREVFKVRKVLSRQIKTLKSENEKLVQGTSNAESGRGRELTNELSKVVSERDEARTQLLKVKSDLEKAKTDFASQGLEREKSTQEKLSALESEIESHKSQIGDLELSLSTAKKNNGSQMEMFEQEKDDLMRKIESSETEATKTANELAKKNNEIIDLTEKVKAKIVNIEESEQNVALLTKERDALSNRCSVLETELTTLKRSFNDATLLTSSKDDLLKEAQKENADRIEEVTKLRSEIGTLQKSASETEQNLKTEVKRLQTDLTKSSDVAKSQEAKISQLRAEGMNFHKQLEVERALKEKEVSEKESVEGVLRDLNSRHSSLKRKLAEEQSLRKTTQEDLSGSNAKAMELEGIIGDLEEKLIAKKDEVARIERENEDLRSSAKSLKEQLSSLSAKSREQDRELKSVQDKLASSESSREILEQQVCDAGGKSEKVVAELNALRSELGKAHDELHKSNARFEEELVRVKAEHEKSVKTIGSVEQENERLKTECNKLQSKLERTEKEVREKRGSHLALQSDLEGVQQRLSEMESELAEKTSEMTSTRRDLTRAQERTDRANQKYVQMVEEHDKLKRHVSRVEGEKEISRGEQMTSREEALRLAEEVSKLQGQIRSVSAEHEERILKEKSNLEREAKRASDFRKDLRVARDLVQSLQIQLDEKTTENEDLRRKIERNEDGEDAHNSVLNDLISARLELALAQDEVIRLRNKLKKVEGKGPGNSSFEY